MLLELLWQGLLDLQELGLLVNVPDFLRLRDLLFFLLFTQELVYLAPCDWFVELLGLFLTCHNAGRALLTTLLERAFDRATAVNGTGPAIIAEFVKAFMEAATYIGEPRELARASVLSTLKGTVEMIAQSEDHVAQLVDEVTSPGGTTSRALQVLKKGRMAAVVTDSVDAAYQRTLELGRGVPAK